MNELATSGVGFESRVIDEFAVARFTGDTIKIQTEYEPSLAWQAHLDAIDSAPDILGYIQIFDDDCDSLEANKAIARFIAEEDEVVFKNGRALGTRSDLIRDRSRNILGSYLLKLVGFSKPLVAGIHGDISAEDLSLSLAFDARIATASATISFDNVRTGIPASPGITDLMPRYIGIGKTLDMANKGATIDAHAALELGLINQVVESIDDLTRSCLDHIKMLTKQHRDVVHFNRRNILPQSKEIEVALDRYYQAVNAAFIASRNTGESGT